MMEPEGSSYTHADVLQHNAAEDALSVRGVRTVPQQVETGSIKYVCDLNFAGFGQQGRIKHCEHTTLLVGLAATDITGVALIRTGTNFASNDPIFTNGENARILCASAKLIFDVAGLAAFGAHEIEVLWDLQNFSGGGGPVCDVYRFTRQTGGGEREYHFVLSNNLFPIVYDGFSFDVHLKSADTTPFPANTSVVFSAYAIIKRIGGQLPL